MNSTSQVRVLPEGLRRSRVFYTYDLPQASELRGLCSCPDVFPVDLHVSSELSDSRPVQQLVELTVVPPETTDGWPASLIGFVYAADAGSTAQRPAEITLLPTGKAVVKILS